jgi:molecular chaperone GrpE
MTDPRPEDNEKHTDIFERPEEPSPPVNVSALKADLIDARAKAQEYLEGWQRGQADFVNLKRRLEQDKLDAVKYANSGLILRIIPVLDDFERAVEAVPPSMAEEAWVGGINGIGRKLYTLLEAVGVSRIAAQGEMFDPAVHEAVGSAPGAEGMVMRELGTGYKLNERVLRPARVLVGSGEDDDAESSEE